MSMSTSLFPTDLRAELKRRGMTQRDLAGATNIEEATISRYCHGLAPTEHNAARIVEALGLLSRSGAVSAPQRVTVTEDVAA